MPETIPPTSTLPRCLLGLFLLLSAASCGQRGFEPAVTLTPAPLTAAAGPFIYEAETLTRTASATGSQVTSEAAASGGQYVQLSGTPPVGSWVQFTLPSVTAGTYAVQVLSKTNTNRAIVQASIDGVNQGGTCNQYSSTPVFQVSCSLGNKTFTAGNHTIRFTATSKSSSSTGYMVVIDQVSLSSGTGGTGGASGTGGTSGTGGVSGTGGASGTGGTSGTGGVSGSGGTTGGAGGAAGAAGGNGGTGTSPNGCVDGALHSYFVDSVAGNDARDGITTATAWRSLTPVNGHTFQPGDYLCFKAGGSWIGQLSPAGSGSAGAPIVIAQYGTGAKPIIAAGPSDLQTLLLTNQQYWEVNDLELTNNKTTPGDLRAISIRGRDVGVLRHIVIRNTFVHDVTGVVNWIGGSTANNSPPWVTFQTGWDASKRTGGIVFEIESTNSTPTWFDDVTIEKNIIQNVSFGGIIFKQLEGSVGWGVRSSPTDTRFTPHRNIVIRDNYLSQTNTQYGCNALYVTGAQTVLIDHNVVKDAGTSGIEAYNTDDVVIQRNEVYGTVRKAGGTDYNGIDADRATTNTVIQYNYVHNNGDGILLCEFVFGSSIVRYNLVINNSRYSLNLHSDSAATNQTYNNLFFAEGLSGAILIDSSGGSAFLTASYAISNNIFRNSRTTDVARTGSGVRYTNNLFSGLPAAAGGTGSRTGDPMFVNSTVRPNGTTAGPALDQLGGFKLKSGSPAINNGVTIANNGGRDFWATPVYVGAPDIGPYEAP